MSFSLDLTKPLGRLGLAINTLVLGVVFYGISVVAYYYMSHTLPESDAHAKEAAAKAALVDKAVAKAKTAAKGKAFDEKAAVAAAESSAEPEVKKQAEEIHHHAVEGWAPFAIFLLILSALFFSGFLSVYVQRRANDGGLKGLWIFTNHLGAWAFASYVASILSSRLTVCVMPGLRPSSAVWCSSCRYSLRAKVILTTTTTIIMAMATITVTPTELAQSGAVRPKSKTV